MSDEFWRQFQPIPGFNSIATKRRAQEQIYEETKGMTPRELVEYFRGKADARSAGSRPATLALNKDSPIYGDQ